MKRAFTIIELLVIIVAVVLLVSVLLPGISRAKHRARGEACCDNLKWIALAFKTSGLDGWDNFVTGQSTNFGGAKEYLLKGEVFRGFSWMSNELGSPKVLIRLGGCAKAGARL